MSDAAHANASPFSIPNVRRFVAFRIFFNARFYYPVFTIMFLDFGLNLNQFALLNAVWAATIVLAEVPSGALADVVGRRRLLAAAGALMVLEMALLSFVPLGNLNLLLAVFVLNRILSGVAEAAASGADEALAYDSLRRAGQAHQWGRVLEVQMRLQSAAFIVAMSLGAAVYDPVLMQALARGAGFSVELDQSVTLRFPIYLCLAMAVLSLASAWRMTEVAPEEEAPPACGPEDGCGRAVTRAFRLTLDAGAWILRMPLASVVILGGLLFDGVLRMTVTLTSQYYRLIQVPEATFGLIGSGMALLGVFLPALSRRLAETRSPAFNLAVLSGVSLAGLTGMTFFFPVFGVLPVVLIFAGMQMTWYLTSHYLNRLADSRHRATVLSFKGLSFNLAYGAAGLGYSALIHVLRDGIERARPGLGAEALQDAAFVDSVQFFPWVMAAAILVLVVFGARRLRGEKPAAEQV